MRMTSKTASTKATSTPIEPTAGSDLDTFTHIEQSQDLPSNDSLPIEGWNHHGSSTAQSARASSAIPPHNRLRRAWDSYDAYLFDIDGTLLHCKDAVHYFAFCDALTRAAGRPVTLDGIAVQGKIDPGILRDAFHHAGVPEQQWRPQLASLLQRMGEHVEAHAAEFDIEVLPGVRETLTHLQERGKLLGVGTGNLQRIGWAKLSHCGLRGFFTLGGFSDNYEMRGDMIAGAVAAARATLNNPDAAVLVLGDTPGDIAAARFAGVDVIAIATGIYTAAQLAAADLVIGSMLDLARS
jgi:phosphoglycolate phosphatase